MIQILPSPRRDLYIQEATRPLSRGSQKIRIRYLTKSGVQRVVSTDVLWAYYVLQLGYGRGRRG